MSDLSLHERKLALEAVLGQVCFHIISSLKLYRGLMMI